MDNKLKTSLFCYTCCINDENNDEVQKILHLSDDQNHDHHLHGGGCVNLQAWIKTELPDIKDRCANIISSKFGRNRQRGNINPVEFRYDPLSYALNFEDTDSRVDEFRPRRNFSSRLPPPSPPLLSPEKRVASTVVSSWS